MEIGGSAISDGSENYSPPPPTVFGLSALDVFTISHALFSYNFAFQRSASELWFHLNKRHLEAISYVVYGGCCLFILFYCFRHPLSKQKLCKSLTLDQDYDGSETKLTLWIVIQYAACFLEKVL